VIALTIGGNDVGFTDALAYCFDEELQHARHTAKHPTLGRA
jgi:hypothetical protein